MVSKKVLRQTYLEKRLTLTQAEYQYRNELLQKQVLENVNLNDSRTAHFFLSIIKNKEVDTRPIIDQLEDKYPALQIAVSKTLPKRQLKHFILNKHTQLAVSSWGIPEPEMGEEISDGDINTVFVPLIVCDKLGYRIGYGGGYYDIFLSKIPNAKKIGLSLSPLLDEIPYVEEFDIKLDSCITPFEVYDFK